MAKLRSARLEAPPERVGSFRIEGALGVGGMGAVYRAWDERLHRTVAIKHVLPDAADERSRERLRREAQAAAGLNHPSIVQIYDILEVDGVDWIVMELVEGQTLGTLVEAGRLGLAEAVQLVREIAEGLAEAHGKNVVHRDLKTENVMVTRSFHAKILDFGLAKNIGVPLDRGLSGITSVLGTSRSMSPEQAMGEEVDHRSDLFSLGTLAFEAATGQPPFVGTSTFNTLAKVCSARHQPAHQVNRRVPIELSNLIDRLLEKNPAHRPQSAREVVVELRYLEKQRLSEWGGVYTPGHAWDDAPPAAAAPAAAASAPRELKAPPLREPERQEKAEVGDAPTGPDASVLEEEGTVAIAGLTSWQGDPGETSEMPIFQPAAVAGLELGRPSVQLRTLVAAHAAEKALEPQLRRFFEDLQRRHRVRWGELGALAAETEIGPVFLFERPIFAVQFALFAAEVAEEEALPLPPRFGVNVGEIVLGYNTDHHRHALRAGGPTCRVTYRLAELAAPGQVLVTPETAALARRALLDQPGELDWRQLGPLFFDELGETLHPFEAVALQRVSPR